MNVAIVKHIGIGAPDKEYLFKAPSGVKILKGTLVKVKVKRGESYAVLTRDSFDVDGDALEYIENSVGVPHGTEVAPIISVLYETPVSELPPCGVSCNLRVATKSTDTYYGDFSSYPVTYRARRKDNGEYIDSYCVYSTKDGCYYLSVHDETVCISSEEKTNNIYSIEATDNNPIFVEVEPKTIQWSVSK